MGLKLGFPKFQVYMSILTVSKIGMLNFLLEEVCTHRTPLKIKFHGKLKKLTADRWFVK